MENGVVIVIFLNVKKLKKKQVKKHHNEKKKDISIKNQIKIKEKHMKKFMEKSYQTKRKNIFQIIKR